MSRGGGCLWPVSDQELCRREVLGDSKVCADHIHMIHPPPGNEEEAAQNIEIINEIIRYQNEHDDD